MLRRIFLDAVPLVLLLMIHGCLGWTCLANPDRNILSNTFRHSLFHNRRSTHHRAAASKEEPSSTEPVAADTKSTVSRFLRGALLVKSVVQNVSHKSNETDGVVADQDDNGWQVPEWMWGLVPGVNVTQVEMEKRQKVLYRKPQWMKSAAFQGLTRWAFDMCDAVGDGRINKDELYAGVLLVHLHLAKYVGVTACTPLNRTEVNQLFDMAAAQDPLSLVDRQTIGRQAFADIVVYSCAKISSRMVVYYVMLVLLVPFLTKQIMGGWNHIMHTLTVGTRYLIRGKTVALPRGVQILTALVEWTVQYFLSIMVVTVVMPWIFVKLQAHAPQWMLPSRQRTLWGRRKW